MKIAQIVCSYPPYKGGMGNSAARIAEVLQEGGLQTDTFTPDYSGKEKKEPNVFRIKTPIKYGKGAVLFRVFFDLRKYDAIYLHYPFFGTAELIWLYSFLSPKKKLVIHYHMDTPGLAGIAKILRWPSEIIKKSLFNRADFIISASIDYICHSRIKKIYQENKEKFIEIPFFVDTEKFKPAKNKEIKEEIKIIFVGGLDKNHYFKGLNILISALAGIKSQNWQLRIIGQGELKKDYEKQARNLKLSDKIIFCDKVEDDELREKLAQSDFFVFPSVAKNEAFGIVLIEAMASGLPVIASDLPGVRTVFENEKEGLLVKPSDKNDLADKISFLIKNPEKITEMGKNARLKAEKKYSREKIGKKFRKVFL